MKQLHEEETHQQIITAANTVRRAWSALAHLILTVNSTLRRYYFSYFIDEETEGQGAYRICLRSLSEKGGEGQILNSGIVVHNRYS